MKILSAETVARTRRIATVRSSNSTLYTLKCVCIFFYYYYHHYDIIYEDCIGVII